MSGEEAIQYILDRKRGGPKPGLSRMQMLMEKLGNPQQNLKCVHVAGTNGKGSCCSLTASVLQSAGYKVGLTISPFVLQFRERIQVAGQMISLDDLGKIVAKIKSVCDEMDKIDMYANQFEIITAAAFVYFAQCGCDIAVLEVGLGGRYDATNVVKQPLVCAIMSISLDHTQLLGDTEEKIAWEKSGIIKQGCPVVCYPDQHLGALEVIANEAKQKNAPLIMPSKQELTQANPHIDGCDFCYKQNAYHTPFGGMHQVYNAMVVLEIVSQLRKSGLIIDQQAVTQGLRSAVFPARIELLQKDPPIIIDGAHNPSGAKALSAALNLLPQQKIGIIGLLSDKDSTSMAQTLGHHFTKLFLVTPQNYRAKQAKDLKLEFLPYCNQVVACDTLGEAVQMALAAQQQQALIICGSLYLASEARAMLKNLL